MKSSRKLVLASASPRRKELLTEAGHEFSVMPSTLREPENTDGQASPRAWAEALSFFKACYVGQTLRDATVIGADTIVALDGRIYGKAVDAEDARRILTALMHHPHQVITGITLLDTESRRREITHAVTRVTMRPMSPAQLDAYLASGLWQGKAGAYGIQDHDDAFVTNLEGSFSNVVGLPMEILNDRLLRWGYAPARRSN